MIKTVGALNHFNQPVLALDGIYRLFTVNHSCDTGEAVTQMEVEGVGFFLTVLAIAFFLFGFFLIRGARRKTEPAEGLADGARQDEIEFTGTMEDLAAILKALPEVEVSVKSLPPDALLPDETDVDEYPERPEKKRQKEPGASVGLVIDYKDSKGNETSRRIRINGIYESTSGEDVLRAYCYERRAPRNFLVSRIFGAYDPETGEIYDDYEDEIYRATAHLVTAAPKRKPRKKRDYPVITDFSKAYAACYRGIKILAYIGRVDGHFHPEEREVVARWCAEVCEGAQEMLEWDPDVFMAYVDKQYPSFADFEKCLKMEMDFGDNRLTHIMKAALKLIAADGVIDTDETGAVEVIEKYIR